HVEKMYLFGSALNSNFNSKSDIDFLVKFKVVELKNYFENYINFKENLKNILGRDVVSCPEIALHLKVIKYERTMITKSQIKEEQLSPKVRKLRGIFKSENDLN